MLPSAIRAAGKSELPGLERFSTIGLHDGRRLELWEQHNAETLLGLSARTLDGDPLEATEITLAFERLRFAHVAASAHVVERSADEISRTPNDGVALYFALSGDSFFYHRDGVELQKPGGLLICDTDEPFLRGFARGLEELVLTVPRSVFADVSDEPVSRTPRTLSFADIPGANAHATALAGLVSSALTRATAEELADVELRAIALLRGIFTRDAAHSASAHRHAALAYIERRLRDPRLGVAAVARAVGLSERQLARSFAETGTGVARLILDRRLDLAHRILSSPGSPAVGEVAGQCGFSSHAHFTRVYRERFEEAPSQTRAGPLTTADRC